MTNGQTSSIHKSVSLRQYKKEKIQMLQRDFCIKLSEEDIAHANTLTTEVQLDKWALGILNREWG